jgi:hypothetical protein
LQAGSAKSLIHRKRQMSEEKSMTTNTTQHVAEDWKIILELEIDAAGAVARKEVRNSRADTIDNKLIGRLYPGIRVARVTLPDYMSAYEEAEVEKRMKALVFDDISYKLVGVSGSAKQTRFYFVDTDHHPRIAKRFQRWPEAMVTYFRLRNCSGGRQSPRRYCQRSRPWHKRLQRLAP